jgi:hypothetical protein
VEAPVSPPSATPVSPLSPSPAPSLVATLRSLDKQLLLKRCHDAVNPRTSQLMETASLLADTTALFEDLCQRIDWVNHPAVLCDILDFNRPVYLWGNLSQENRVKMVASVRSICRTVVNLLQLRRTAAFTACLVGIERVSKNMKLYDESIDCNDYSLTTMYELLIECSNALDLIRRCSEGNQQIPNGEAVPLQLTTEKVETKARSSLGSSQGRTKASPTKQQRPRDSPAAQSPAAQSRTPPKSPASGTPKSKWR